MSKGARTGSERPDRQQLILNAAVAILGTDGASGLSMRAVAKEAGVSLGLVNYHYEDKASLIKAALHTFEEADLAITVPNTDLDARSQLCDVLSRIVRPEFLTTDYLALRLQLWALAQADEEFAEINAAAQRRYRQRLATLIAAAVPTINKKEANQRAADIDIIQNGIWLTALLRIDKAAIRRAAASCESIALTGS